MNQYILGNDNLKSSGRTTKMLQEVFDYLRTHEKCHHVSIVLRDYYQIKVVKDLFLELMAITEFKLYKVKTSKIIITREIGFLQFACYYIDFRLNINDKVTYGYDNYKQFIDHSVFDDLEDLEWKS